MANRRVLKFSSVDEVLAEAERLAAGPIQCLGNWSAGQIFKHLAQTIDNSIDGVPFRAPLFVRLIMKVMRRSFLSNKMQAGFQMPKYMADYYAPPNEVSTSDGLSALRAAVARYRTASTLAPSPAFGEMTRAEYDQLHTRHGELHLSFLQ